MFYVDVDNNIYITKGDSAVLDVEMTRGGEEYEMQEGDKLIFAARVSNDFNYPVITIESDNYHLPFYDYHTNELSAVECDYSITLKYADGTLDTFLIGKFTIMGVSYGTIE